MLILRPEEYLSYERERSVRQELVEVYSQRETRSCLRLERPDDLLRLESVDFSISLAELYE